MTVDDSPRSARWQRVRDLFDRAAELRHAERRELLDQIEEHDLRQEVESLLEALDSEEGFLETPAASLLTDPTIGESSENRVGERVGAYVLLRLVGSGGMGVVYEAERADEQYRQRVAIKLMRRGVHSGMILARFRRERQILASLNHPHIARLLDGGVTNDGQPYYVMEYVDGIPITHYCERRRMPLRGRLELFRDVCDAVHFAHRNLVVHRDLKPGNILVTRAGQVKLLDFGIAKLLSADAAGGETLTLLSGRMLTPAYASPEQVLGEHVTTAADVYSLGVVLYELLTGRKPFDVDTPSLKDAVERVVSMEPTRPSAAITDATLPQFGEGPGWKIRRTLEGELDNIVLMALRKDPERRYKSVAELSEDVLRFLTARPVVAQRDTAAYRINKFFARHRWGAMAATVVLVLLVTGLAATIGQARRADRARGLAEARSKDARDLANALLFDVHDAIADLPGATAARELVVTRGLDYLDRMAGEATDDPSLQSELANAYLQLGLIQGAPTGPSLGQVSQAELSFARALAIASGVVEASPSDDRARRTLALAHEKLGDVMAYRGAVADGLDHARKALAVWSYFAESKPDDEQARLAAVISHVKLGDLLGNPSFNNLEDEAGAIGEYRYALSLLGAPILANSDSPRVLRYRALVYERLGQMLRLEGRYAEALESLAQALAARLELSSDESTDLLRDVAVTFHQICGVHLSLGDAGSARQNCGSMLALYQRLFDGDPMNAQAGRDLASGHEILYEVALERGRSDEAAASLRRSLEVRDRLLERSPEDLVNRRDWARAHIRLCEIEFGSSASTVSESCTRGRATLLDLRESGVTTSDDEQLIQLASERIG